jgi:hypothetical protein
MVQRQRKAQHETGLVKSAHVNVCTAWYSSVRLPVTLMDMSTCSISGGDALVVAAAT